MIVFVEQVPLYFFHEERTNVVLELFHHDWNWLIISSHCSLQRFCENEEFLVIDIGVQGLSSLNAIYDKAQTGLDVFDAHWVWLFLEIGELGFPVFSSFLTPHLDVGQYFLPAIVQVLVVVWIEYPVLYIFIHFYCQKC